MAEAAVALDTNVLVRFLVQDDAAQGRAAAAVMQALSADAPGFVCREVLLELVWVLERAYRLPRAEIAAALTGLLEAREIEVETPERAGRALDRYGRGGPGFADQMILLAAEAEGRRLVSFDRGLAAAGAVQPG